MWKRALHSVDLVLASQLLEKQTGADNFLADGDG